MSGTVLRLVDVEAGYGSGPVFSGLNLVLGPSEGACLMGPNGCGKSTVLRCLVGLADLQAGAVEILGMDAGLIPKHELARWGVGYVPQGRGDFPSLTVDENLRLATAATEQPAVDSVRERVLAELPSLRPLLRRRISGLSGGERTLVALARAVAIGDPPRLLLLDEISAGLSPSNLAFVASLLSRLRERGATLLVAEQNPSFARSLNLPFIEPRWQSRHLVCSGVSEEVSL